MLSPFLSLFYILTLPVLSWFLQLSLSYHPNLLCDRYCMSISLCSMFMESCRVLPLHSARTWNICSGSFPFNIPSALSWPCWNTLYLIQETALTEIGYWQVQLLAMFIDPWETHLTYPCQPMGSHVFMFLYYLPLLNRARSQMPLHKCRSTILLPK